MPLPTLYEARMGASLPGMDQASRASPSHSTARFWRKLVIDLTTMVGIGVVMAVIGPYGSFQASFPVRLAYWVGLGLAGYAFYRPIGWLVEELGKKLELPTALLWVGACLLATVPMTAVVIAIDRLPRGMGWPGFEDFATYYGYVLVVGSLVTVLFFLLERAKVVPSADQPLQPIAKKPPTASVASGPRFLDRLPPELGSELIALEMEDHYVRAHTGLGSDLVLLRLRDAIAELDGIEGMQVHRSWWVARGAVADVKRDGRNIRLVLDGGLEAPVSRANVQPLKDAGWI